MPTESSPIHATLRYLVNSPRYATEQPYRLIEVPPTPEVPLTNMEFETHSDVPITNIREAQGSLSIEDNAFQLYEIPSSISIDATYGEVESYCKSMADFIQAELGALRVFIFEFRFRSNEESFVPLPASQARAMPAQGTPAETFSAKPVWIAHLDQTYKGGSKRIRRHLTEEEADIYLSGGYRVRIINVWRTFNSTPHDMPLAFCDPKTVSTDDLIAVDLVGPNKPGESYYLFYNDQHKWYWASDMKPSEAMVFTTWDSEVDSQATRCACHTAFPSAYENTSPRLSLEVRMIVINSPAS